MSNNGPRFNGRLMDVRRDSADFRDRIYQPTLRPLRPRMLYEMAKRHDRWPGEAYDGSSARGAMKGWHKNGVCPASVWPYEVSRPGFLTPQARLAALSFPLGAYYRVLKKRSDMHGALTETGAIFATGAVHEGWDHVDQGVIPYDRHAVSGGGHAFCILGYTDDGFIIQNSWGSDWGGLTVLDEDEERYYPGLAIWTYADFERNFWDAWVARMALPVRSLDALDIGSIVQRPGGPQKVQRAPRQDEIADHYIHIDDGQFDPRGDYPSSLEETRSLIQRAVDATAATGGRDTSSCMPTEA